MDKQDLRELFRQLAYLKPDSHLARGELSRIIRSMQEMKDLHTPELLEYARENIGLGASPTHEEEERFAEIKTDLLGRLKTELVMRGDDDWVSRFDPR